MVLVAAAPVKKIAPLKVPAKSFHSVSAKVPVEDLPTCHLTMPPELKKLKNAVLLAKVTV